MCTREFNGAICRGSLGGNTNDPGPCPCVGVTPAPGASRAPLRRPLNAHCACPLACAELPLGRIAPHDPRASPGGVTHLHGVTQKSLNSSNAAHRRSCAIRLAVRLIRGTAPKGAKMFAASDMTSRCEAQSSRLVPSRTTRHLQRASRSGQISRTGSKTTNGVVQFQSR